MGAGRPSKYKPEYAKQMVDFFDKEPYKKEGNRENPVDFPFLEDFADEIGVTYTTLYLWGQDKKNKPEFFKAYARAKKHQERILVINALRGNYKPSFAEFVAKAVCGLTDAPQQEDFNDKLDKIVSAMEKAAGK